MKAESTPATMTTLDVARLRADFPVLTRRVHDRPLVYLDNAATSQKPAAVIETESRYYREYNANIHRGVHRLSEEATEAYEGAREKIRAFINAASTREIIFTSGTTESINLVAQSYGQSQLQEGDEILITAMEHHSNIVPWQLLGARTGAVLKVIPITDEGELEPGAYEKLLGPRTRLVAITHISNALGTINPVAEMIRLAHERDIPVLIDGAQSIPHATIDVRALDCDFFCFSGHKLYGPTGTGVLYGKEHLLDAMPPWKGGGDMIRTVRFEQSTWNDLPHKFEAGTPHISGFIGLGAAIDYINHIGMPAMVAHEDALLDYATGVLTAIPGLRLIGTARNKASILSFVMEGIHPHDIGTILDRQGVAIRTGHHCAMPVMERYCIPATARASLAAYNTREEIDALAAAILQARKVLT